MPAGEAGGTWAVGVRLFAYFLAEESRSAGGPRPALCLWLRQFVNNEKSASSQSTSSARSYQNSIVLSPATEAGNRPGRRVTFLARTRNVTQRMCPNCLRPCASLRANLRHAIQSAVRQNSLCAARAAQTRCRKLDDEATLSFGSVARSLNNAPQALTHGWMQVLAACLSCAVFSL